MQKTVKKRTIIRRTTAAIALGLLVTYTSYPGVKTAIAQASCNSISECNNQIAANNNAVKNLKNEAVSYQDAVVRLQSQINMVQGQIAESKRQQADLEAQIADAQAKLEHQKSVLGEIMRTMYIDGQMTTIEALATSNNLSDYIDKEENREQVTSSIQDTMGKISKLQSELNTKKQQVARLLAEQQSQASQLASDRAQQSSMLAYNQSQQASYNSQTKANQAKLEALIAAQRRANEQPSAGGYSFIRFPGSVGDFDPGAYPYKNAGFSMSTAPGCNDNDGPDKWGYCTRQCVSYAAWAVEASGRSAPKYYGNAKNWDDRARAAGISVYGSPQPGDIAVSNSGTWGHVMYVEAVDGDRMYVSQYNQTMTGQFSYQWRTWQ
jgi:peptidoglycan hydrolase CwlO-like protein